MKRLPPSWVCANLLLAVLCAGGMHASDPGAELPDPDPLRFTKEIEAFAAWERKNSPPDRPILFVGSSSIRFWPSADSFPDCPIVNRGFGGAHISDVAHFCDRVVTKVRPTTIVFYAGDNDIAAGKDPQQVFEDFSQLLNRIHADLVGTTVFYLPIKPSPRRWTHWQSMTVVNRQIEELAETDELLVYVDLATPMLDGDGQPRKELFVPDMLHLNLKGYELWSSILAPYLSAICGADSQEGGATR